MASSIDSTTFDSSSSYTSADKIRENHEKYKDLIKNNNDEINQQTFMKLLVAEMTNQDPLEPTSNTEYVSQLAQFSAMSAMQDTSRYSMATFASNLVGKIASASEVNKDGKKVDVTTGIVEKVTKDSKADTYIVTIDGKDFDISKVSTFSSSSDTVGGMSNVNLGNAIANASMMIGMFASVKQKGTFEDGSGMVDSGIVESVKVVDGKIKVIINGLPYDLSSVTEVSYAKSEVNPDDSTGKVDGDDNTGTTDKVDGSDKPDGTDNKDDTSNVNDNGNGENSVDSKSVSSRLSAEIPAEYNAAAEAQSLKDTEDIEDLDEP